MERFCEYVSNVFNSWNVNDVQSATRDAITNEVISNLYVLHASMMLRILSASDCSLIIAIDRGCGRLMEARVRW